MGCPKEEESWTPRVWMSAWGKQRTGDINRKENNEYKEDGSRWRVAGKAPRGTINWLDARRHRYVRIKGRSLTYKPILKFFMFNMDFIILFN